MKKFNKIGFTLTELLIVVIIIGILATLSLPMLVKTIEKARVDEAINNLNLIRSGQKIYFLEYGEYSPNLTDLNIENPNSAASRYFEYTDDQTQGGAITRPMSDFKAKNTRGGGDAKDGPEPYQDDLYYTQKDGTVHGRFTTGEAPTEP